MKKLLTIIAFVMCTLYSMADNKIYYTSTDGKVVEPHNPEAFGANIVSNTCKNGQGVITFDGEITKIGEDAFYECKQLASIVIPESVKQLDEYAFSGCINLKSIIIPDSVISIGKYAFEYCKNLTSVTIGNSVTSIGKRAFEMCEKLQSIIIPNSVVSIAESAFSACNSLTSVTFGSSITSIYSSSFGLGRNIKEMYFYSESVPNIIWDDGEWYYIIRYYNCRIYVPATAVGNYQNAWEDASIIPISENRCKELSEFFTQLMHGETASGSLQGVYNECVGIVCRASNDDEARLALNGTCKQKLINAWVAEKKEQVEAARKGANNDYVNEVYTDVMYNIDIAAGEGNIGAVRQTVTAGIGAIISARILYRQLEQGITPATPQGAGMRMKVTRKNGKVYEFKTSDIESTEYYRATE